MDYEQIVNQVREILDLGEDGDIPAEVTALTGEVATLRGGKKELDAALKRAKDAEENAKAFAERVAALEAETAALTPVAEDGRQYRDDLVAEALAEGVRAYGENFDAETYEAILRSASLAVIKRMKADWAVIGDSRFSGGRKTKDEGDAPGTRQPEREAVPDSAYRA